RVAHHALHAQRLACYAVALINDSLAIAAPAAIVSTSLPLGAVDAHPLLRAAVWRGRRRRRAPAAASCRSSTCPLRCGREVGRGARLPAARRTLGRLAVPSL